ncbi:hypothetical protein D3C87_1545280 [compost metagenome]
MIRIHQNLPVQIRRDNNPFMGQNKPADTRRSQIQRSRSSQPANSGHHHRRFLQRLLSFFPEQLKLPGIPFQLQTSGKRLHPRPPLVTDHQFAALAFKAEQSVACGHFLIFFQKSQPFLDTFHPVTDGLLL